MQTRKLIAHGPSSLTVALPHKWVKKHHLKKGDDVALNEDDQGLRINAKPSEGKKSISISVEKHDLPSTVTVLTTVYRRGYDEVSIKYETADEYQSISSAIRSLLGYAVMENRRGMCLIKSLPSNLEQDFTTLFRRVFLILLQQLEDLGDLLVNSPESLKTFYHRDADLNAIVNLAIRMINKGYVNDRFEELHLFHALLMLEEMGDDMTKFTIETWKEKDIAKLKEGVDHTSKLLRLLYNGYFQKHASIMEFYKHYYLYWPDVKKSPAPVYDYFAKTSKDKPLFYLRSIVEKVVNLAEILLLPEVQVEAKDTTKLLL